MESIYKDIKKKQFKLKITNNEDFWYLENIIEKGDIVSGNVERRIQLDSNKSKSFRKKFYVDVIVEKIEDNRILGKIVNSNHEEIPNGEHQSINIKIGTIIKIKKKEVYEHQLEYLKEATEKEKDKILIVVLERDNITFALMTKKGYEILNNFEGDVEKKEEKVKITGKSFYEKSKDILEEYVKRYDIDKVILGSPAFWKEDFAKVLDKEMQKRITFVNCNNTGKNGIHEIINRPETKKVLGELRIAKEEFIMKKFLNELKTEGKYVYGLKETKEKAELGAIEELLITDSFIEKNKENEEYNEIRKIFKMVSSSQGKMMILNHKNNAGKQLDGFGGIAAILRWK